MLEVKVAEITTWLREHNMQDKYNVKTMNDPLRGELLALYEIYSNGTQNLVAQSREKDKIISYLNMKISK